MATSSATMPSALAEKENASIQSYFDKSASKDRASGRKRTITLLNGEELDLNGDIVATAEIVEAMKDRIIQLEDELSSQRPAKRAKTTVTIPNAAESSSSTGPSTSATKADEKKRKLQLKKVFDRLKKECKSDTVKFQGSPKTIKFDEVLEKAEFDAIFLGKGTLIQPTPQNKPKSTVTIIEYNSIQVHTLFGDVLKALKGNRWTRGGIPVRTFGGGFGGFGSTFAKSVKQGSVDVSIRSLEVNYSKNGMKCALKFEVAQDYGVNEYSDSDY